LIYIYITHPHIVHESLSEAFNSNPNYIESTIVGPQNTHSLATNWSNLSWKK